MYVVLFFILFFLFLFFGLKFVTFVCFFCIQTVCLGLSQRKIMHFFRIEKTIDGTEKPELSQGSVLIIVTVLCSKNWSKHVKSG